MATPSITPQMALWRRPPLIKSPALRWTLALVVALYLAAAFGTLNVDWGRVAEGGPRALRFFGGFFPPDFLSRWDAILDGLLESLWMSVAATALGVLISIPIAIGGARNVAPMPVYLFCRSLMAVSRTFHEVLIAIFFRQAFRLRTFRRPGYPDVCNPRVLRQAFGGGH